MSERWLSRDLAIALRMYEAGYSHQAIGDILGKTMVATTSTIGRYATPEIKANRKIETDSRTADRLGKKDKKKKLKAVANEAEEKLRQDVYILGMNDKDSAKKANLRLSTWIMWRKTRGLENHIVEKISHRPYLRKIEKVVAIPHVSLQHSDIKYYRHNINTLSPVEFIADIKIIIPANDRPINKVIADMTDQGRVTARRIHKEIERRSYTAKVDNNNLAYAQLQGGCNG